MRTARAPLTVGFVLSLGLALAGCQGQAESPSTRLVPVKGTITYKGKPLTGGRLIFEPDTGGREAHGAIGPDGTFVLTTFEPEDGAVVGLNRVAIHSSIPASKKGLPVKFRSFSASGVTVEVNPGQESYTIELE